MSAAGALSIRLAVPPTQWPEREGQFTLELQVRYHTHCPASTKILAILDGAQNLGVEIRQNAPAAQAHQALVNDRYRQADKPTEDDYSRSY